MQKSTKTDFRKTTVFCFVILGLLLAALVILPYQFTSKAGKQIKAGEGLITRTESHEEGLENYDIRADKSAYQTISQFRNASNKDAAAVADLRETFVRGEEALRSKVPTLKVEYNTDIRIPEVIAPDVKQGRNFLTSPSGASRVDILRDFVKENNDLIGVTDEQVNALRVPADYTNPNGDLSFTHLEQIINGVPVFRSDVKAGFTRNGEMIRVINNLAPGLDYESLSNDFRNPVDSVKSAFRNINSEPGKFDIEINNAASTDLKAVFGHGDWATTAEKMYFPTEPGVARTAWRVLIWQPVNAFYVIVDAETGTMLWRKNITEDQIEPATYQVYANPNAMVNSAESPAPLTPGPISPLLGTQGPLLTRVNITRVGNEAPYAFNNNGWITDGTNITDGNANEAGIDRVAPNGVDAPQAGNPNRVFDSTWNPPPGNPPPGDLPLTAQAQRGAVIQMFYAMNLYHDELYRLGFTEQARNFQQDNFGRGGTALDRVSSEGQDSSGTNNANFSTPADGGRGRMQMYIFTGPDPDRDGTTDIDIIYHEATHGTSNRLHGNGSGLSLNMSRGMGEGWSDFYAHAMLSEPSDPLDGIYTTGGYVLVTPTYFGNFYYGIRRFPKARMSFTGGPSNRPHNPLTFADIDGLQINLNDGAFAPRGGGNADQVHNAGEVWSSALWEVRCRLVNRLGWTDGNRKALQFVTDGMKLAPLGPTFLTERDAIIAAAVAGGTADDVADVWAGFAIRGMGFSSSIQSVGTGAGDARVTEAFDQPNLLQTPAISISDASGDNDGFPEPGEPITINFPLSNTTGNTASNVTVQLVGGGLANYGTMNHGATVTLPISYTVPSATPCGSALALTFNVNSSIGATSFMRTIIIGVPSTILTENFDGVTAPALPVGWTATVVQNGINFVTSTTNPDTALNSVFALDPLTVGGGTDLTSPSIPITASAATVSFRNNYNTEPGWDGGVLEISVGGGAFQDIITAGGSFVANGYNGVLGSNGVNNPLAGRNAWSGNSGGYLTSTVRLPASAAGQNVQLKWRFGADDNTAATGWNVDTVRVNGSYGCSFTPALVRAPFDFDGDNKTDLSIFRPGPGQWWYQRSSDNAVPAFTFGTSSDQLTPADFTGDNKTDIAFFRPGSGEWFVLRSEDNTFFAFPFGQNQDVPAPGDYDGDGKADAAVFRPSNTTWYINKSSGGTITQPFGVAGDVPVAADYDGDGKADIAIYRPSLGQWWMQRSTAGLVAVTFGSGTDRAVPGDYTGDGKADVAFWRPGSGEWFVLRSENNTFFAFPFGIATDVPAPGDYDGDGKFDAAVFRPSNVTWYVLRSTAGSLTQAFGTAGDLAVPNAYVR